MSSGVMKRMTGVFAGTGAEITEKKVGFRPRKVEVFNVTGNCRAVWLDTMPDGYAQKVVDSGSGTTDISYITTGGITPTSNGFKLGTDSDLNASTEVVHWVAEE